MKRQTTNDLSRAVDAYLQWMASRQYSRSTIMIYRLILKHWVAFANASNMALNDLFTYEISNRSRGFQIPLIHL